MALEDAVVSALLVLLAAALMGLALAAVRRRRSRAFLLLTLAFGLVLAEGILISLAALGVAFSSGVPLSAVAGLQVAALLLIYVASFPSR